MNDTYKKLLELKNSTRTDYFVMAIAYFFDIGYTRAKNITDDDILKVEGNGIMTKDCCEWLMKMTRQIADMTENAIDVVQFCMAEDIFDVRTFADKLSRSDMEEMLETRISNETMYPTDTNAADYYEFRYGCPIEDFALLGYAIPEYEDEEESA